MNFVVSPGKTLLHHELLIWSLSNEAPVPINRAPYDKAAGT
jgi:hypothetical protein